MKKKRSGKIISKNYRPQEILFEKGWTGAETIFVPKQPPQQAEQLLGENNTKKIYSKANEDNGYLVTYVTNAKLQESEFRIYDAQFTNPNNPLITKIKIPNVRIPNGFHALFVPQFIMNEKEIKDRAVVGL